LTRSESASVSWRACQYLHPDAHAFYPVQSGLPAWHERRCLSARAGAAGVRFDERKPKRGDRSRRDDDRYLFLEALISAQSKLYISYIGRSIQDNSERFPSVLVQELVDYIGQSHYLPGDEERNCDESEQRVKAHITCFHSRMPFDPVNYSQRAPELCP
jgi:exonuclease V gamma subunit